MALMVQIGENYGAFFLFLLLETKIPPLLKILFIGGDGDVYHPILTQLLTLLEWSHSLMPSQQPNTLKPCCQKLVELGYHSTGIMLIGSKMPELPEESLLSYLKRERALNALKKQNPSQLRHEINEKPVW
jgi:hypothetical protein